MVDLLPFRGLHYNPKAVDDYSDVVAPPYDVIEPPYQQQLLAKHPANIVRLELGPKTPQDSTTNNVYTRANEYLQQWQQAGTLAPLEAPAFIAYTQCWDGIERKGIITLLRVEAFEDAAGKRGAVLPHEKIIAKYVADRYQLSLTTGCNLSQIFLLYGDPERFVEKRCFAQDKTGWATATDADGVIHQWQPVTDADLIAAIQQRFVDKNVLIADGHHRYTTAISIKEATRKQYKALHGEEPPDGSLLTDYVMVFLANYEDEGLVVYPTHRLLKTLPDGVTLDALDAYLAAQFEVLDDETFDTHSETFVVEFAGRTQRRHLRLKSVQKLANVHPELRALDVTVLDKTVFEEFMGQTAQQLKEGGWLWFDRDLANTQRLVESGEAQVAFYMHPPSVRQVQAICEAGELMPQKSTYFYPKILSGTVLYPYTCFSGSTLHPLSGVLDAALPLTHDELATVRDATLTEAPVATPTK